MTNSILSKTVSIYKKPLLGFIKSRGLIQEDAEDILQDVWYQLMRVDDIEEINNISGWLYKISKNKIIDFFKKKKTKRIEDFAMKNEEGVFEIPDFLLKDSTTPEDDLYRELFWETLLGALSDLPENQKSVFTRNVLEGKTLQQIADEDQKPLKTIISRKGYAVKHLKNRLAHLYKDFY